MANLREPERQVLRVIYQDADLVAVNKPSGLVCHPTKGAPYSSLIGRLRLCLAAAPSPHETSSPRLINRLDRETSGVVLAAHNARVAGELGKIWERHDLEKDYLAIVHGHLARDSGIIDAPLGKDTHSPVAVKDCVRPDGTPAETSYTVARRFSKDGQLFSLVSVRPLTGRKHQIRIHLAHLGHPVVGDKIYGKSDRYYLDFVYGRLTPDQERALVFSNHALHAAALRFCWRGRDWEFRAQPEPWFSQFAGLAQMPPDREPPA